MNSEQTYSNKLRQLGFITSLLLTFVLQLYFFEKIFVTVDQDAYLPIREELFVTPTTRYGFGTGLFGVTWLKTPNHEQALYYPWFPDIGNLKNPAFVDLVGRFLGELFFYYCAIAFLFWNRIISQKILGKHLPLGRFAKHADLLIAWTIISIPFMFSRYSLFERAVWIPDTYTFNEYYYAYSSITYRALLEFVMFIPSKISQEFAIPSKTVFEPLSIFVTGALLISIISLLRVISLRSYHRSRVRV